MTRLPVHPDTPDSSGEKRLPVFLLVFQAVILAGFLMLVVVHIVFSSFISELDEKTVNEKARLAIGEAIIQQIARLETGVYKIATTHNRRGRDIFQDRLHDQMGTLSHMLSVLEKGGRFKKVIRLNMAGREEMVHTITYHADPEQSRFVLEVIDLVPKLEQLSKKVARLDTLLTAGDTLVAGDSTDDTQSKSSRISAFIKTLPPLFTRMKENAGRMFYESSRELAQLEQGIEQRKRRLLQIEVGLIVIIIVSVMAFGLVVTRQIGQSNRRLRRAREEMARAAMAARAGNEAKSVFLATKSHQKRTPMKRVIGMTGLLLEDPGLTDEQRRFVEVIRESGEALLGIINDILDYSKLEAGKLELEAIEFDLSGVLEGVIQLLKHRADSADLELRVRIPGAVKGVYRGDAGRLRQVLMNLVGNAVKFTDKGHVELAVAEQSSDGDARRLKFAVTDTGIGIPEKARARLFQRFSQVDAATSRKYGGSGLGLAISRRLVEAMGGRIGVESKAGKGSTFWFELPLVLVGPSTGDMPVASLPLTPDPLPDPEGREKRGRVLVVEDNAVNQMVATRMLDRMGFYADVAANGIEAVEAVGRLPYDLVLMDMQMPEMNGLDATRAIRSREKGERRIPIVAMTANAMKGDQEACLSAGMDGYLSKPVNRRTLADTLEQFLPGR